MFWVDILDASNNKLGDGPITTGKKWSSRAKISAVGEWSLEVPLAETRLQYATLNRRVRCNAVWPNVGPVYLGGGIIKSRDYGLGSDGIPVMKLSGPDLLHELTSITVKFEVSAANSAPRANLILSTIMAAASGWTLTNTTSGLPEITARFVHESALNALIKTCEKIGAFFWLQAPSRTVVIANTPTTIALTATNLADPVAAEGNPNICLITNVDMVQTAWAATNRVIVYGAGEGEARLTLAMATAWPNGSSTAFDFTYTDAVGRAHTFRLDKTTNTITDTAVVATYGTEETAVAFKDVNAITPNDADMTAAANTLVAQAVNYLVLASLPTEAYRLSVAGLRYTLTPGEYMRVQARKVRDNTTYLNIDTMLMVQEVGIELNENGEQATDLVVGTTWKPEKSGATLVSEAIQKLNSLEAHPQIGANENTLCYREDVDDDYGATFPFWLSRGTIQVNSVILRYTLEKLRSSVKTIGGTATGTVTIPSHAHIVTIPTHTHDVPNHQHVFDVDPGTNSNPVYAYSGGGAAGGLMAAGITSQINVHTNAATGAVTSDSGGGATVASGGAGSGTIAVDISSALIAEYGVFEDPGTPYGASDLFWTANGTSISETPTSIGGGWYEVDITHYLTVAATARPLAYANVVAVGVAVKTGKKVRVTAQIELRTTIQSIAAV